MSHYHQLSLSSILERILESKHQKMIRAISESNRAKVIKLSKKMDINSYTFGGPQWTFLHYAALLGRTDMVELLVTLGANKDSRTSEGKTPLFLAVEHRHLTSVKKLLDLGADKSIPAGNVFIHHQEYSWLTPWGLADALDLTEIKDCLKQTPLKASNALSRHFLTQFKQHPQVSMRRHSFSGCLEHLDAQQGNRQHSMSQR